MHSAECLPDQQSDVSFAAIVIPLTLLEFLLYIYVFLSVPLAHIPENLIYEWKMTSIYTKTQVLTLDMHIAETRCLDNESK